MAFKKLKLWFDKDLAKLLAGKISVVEKKFNGKRFIQNVHKKVELGQKMKKKRVCSLISIG